MRRRGTTLLCTLASLSAFSPSPLRSQDLSVREIVSRCARAMAGADGIQNLRTLRFDAYSPESDRPVTWEIIRPNMVRKERQGSFVLLFDGRQAGWLAGPRRADGTLQGPHLEPQPTWRDFEMDIAIYIPAFFDFPAEYAGRTTVDGSPAHLLRVTLPLRAVVVYAIHAESFLPIRVELPEWRFQKNMGDYRRVGGILFPHRYWTPSDTSQVEVLRNVAVNADLDRARFVFPADVR